MAIDVYSDDVAAERFNERADANLDVPEEGESLEISTISENTREAFGLMQRESVSRSRYNAEEPIRDRNDHIDELLRSGVLDDGEIEIFLESPKGARGVTQEEVAARKAELAGPQEANPYTSVAETYMDILGHPVDRRVINYDRLANYLRYEKGHADVPTTEDLQAKITADLAEQREQAEDVFERSGSWVGRALGTVGGAIWDPVNVPLMLIPGATVAKGSTLAANAGRAAATESVIAAGEEALFIAGQKEFRKKYNLMPADTVKDIAIAAAAGGLIGGAIGGVTHALVKRGDRVAAEPIQNADELPARPAVESAAQRLDENELASASANADTGHPSPEQQVMMDTAYKEIEENAGKLVVDADGRTLADEVADAGREVERLKAFKACLLGGE